MHGKKTYVAAAKSLGLAGAVTTVSDIAQPLAPVAFYVMVVSAISMLIIGLVNKLIPRLWEDRFVTPAAFFTFGLFVMSGVLYAFQINTSKASETGVLAANVPGIETLQRSLGIIEQRLEGIEVSLQSMDDKITDIESSAVSIDTHVASIDRSMADMDVRLEKIKQETSTDPRKELANMGFLWTHDNFLDALKNKDLRAVELYLAGGMKLRGVNYAEFVTHIYSRQIEELLRENDAFDVDINCPRKLSFYRSVNGSDKIGFVKDKCSGRIAEIVKRINSSISLEEEKIAEIENHNKNIDLNRSLCIEELSTISAEQYVSEVENYDYKAESSPQKTVLTQLKGNSKILKILAYRNINLPADGSAMAHDKQQKLEAYYQGIAADIDDIVGKTCSYAYPEQEKRSLDMSQFDRLNSDLMFLSQKYGVVVEKT